MSPELTSTCRSESRFAPENDNYGEFDGGRRKRVLVKIIGE
jgi:hypothetical protein